MLLYLKKYRNNVESIFMVQLVTHGKWGIINKNKINDYFRDNYKFSKNKLKKHFILRNVNENFKKLDDVDITEIDEDEWVNFYKRPDSIGYYMVEKLENGLFLHSRIKSDSGYCNLNSLI